MRSGSASELSAPFYARSVLISRRSFLGLVIGPIFEKALRETLFLSGGDLTIFLTRPISAVLSALCVVAVVGPTIAAFIRRDTSFHRKSEA